MDVVMSQHDVHGWDGECTDCACVPAGSYHKD